jgi:hypothetical protein
MRRVNEAGNKLSEYAEGLGELPDEQPGDDRPKCAHENLTPTQAAEPAAIQRGEKEDCRAQHEEREGPHHALQSGQRPPRKTGLHCPDKAGIGLAPSQRPDLLQMRWSAPLLENISQQNRLAIPALF